MKFSGAVSCTLATTTCSAAGWGRVAGKCPLEKDLEVLVTTAEHELGVPKWPR